MRKDRDLILISVKTITGMLSRSRDYLVLGVLVPVLITLSGLPVMADDQTDACLYLTKASEAEPCQKNRTVDDPVEAFNNLTHHGEWLGFHNNGLAPMRFGTNDNSDILGKTKAHIQGIARSQRPGIPYLFVVSAGEQNSETEKEVGNLMVIEMGSRNKTGERLRSNRLIEGVETSCSVSEFTDRVVRNIPLPGYRHPGTIHLAGDILAIGFEEPIGLETRGGLVRFYDVSDPRYPTPIKINTDNATDNESNFEWETKLPGGSVHKPGYLGLTDLPKGRFLMVTGAQHGEEVHFWRSNFKDFRTVDNESSFDHIATFRAEDLKGDLGDWPVSTGSFYNNYQNFSLVRETEGDRLFMVCGRHKGGSAPLVSIGDYLALYEITGYDNESNGNIQITMIEEERDVIFKNDNSAANHLSLITELCGPLSEILFPWLPFPVTFSDVTQNNANLLAGGGTYVSPSGELLFYATEHYNWGPLAPDVPPDPDEPPDLPYPDAPDFNPIVRIIELRNNYVAQEGSSIFDIKVDAGGPYVVNEGSTVNLDNESSQPSTNAAWVQLFEHSNYEGQSIMIDIADRDKDDYDDFSELDGQPLIDLCANEVIDYIAVLVAETIVFFTDLKGEDFVTVQTYNQQVCIDVCNKPYNNVSMAVHGLWSRFVTSDAVPQERHAGLHVPGLLRVTVKSYATRFGWILKIPV